MHMYTYTHITSNRMRNRMLHSPMIQWCMKIEYMHTYKIDAGKQNDPPSNPTLILTMMIGAQ